MPGDLLVKCAECGVSARLQDTKYVGGVLMLNHKFDCNQSKMARPFIYSTYTNHQAINPSHLSE